MSGLPCREGVSRHQRGRFVVRRRAAARQGCPSRCADEESAATRFIVLPRVLHRLHDGAAQCVRGNGLSGAPGVPGVVQPSTVAYVGTWHSLFALSDWALRGHCGAARLSSLDLAAHPAATTGGAPHSCAASCVRARVGDQGCVGAVRVHATASTLCPLFSVAMSDVPPSRRALQCLICGDRGRFNVGSLRRHQLTRHHGAALPGNSGRGRQSVARDGGGLLPPHRRGDGSARTGADGLLASRGGSGPSTSCGGVGLSASPGVGGSSAASARATTPAGTGCHHQDGRDGRSEPSGQDAGQTHSDVHAEDGEIAAFLAATRQVAERPVRCGRKRSRAAADVDGLEVTYPSLSTRVWALYEGYNDTARAQPLARVLKHSKAGMFNSNRLRLLQTFVYKTGGCGLSGTGVSDLWELFNEWEPTTPASADEPKRLTDIFPNPHALQQALSDDIDEAIGGDGWLACNMVEDGESYDTFYRPGLPVLLQALSESNKVRYWCRRNDEDGPSDCRETPFDGDAFRLCEEDVMREHGDDAFVLGIHVFSDSCVMSSSGGKCCASGMSLGGGSYLRRASGGYAAGQCRSVAAFRYVVQCA